VAADGRRGRGEGCGASHRRICNPGLTGGNDVTDDH
jgi:hypothetical protein